MLEVEVRCALVVLLAKARQLLDEFHVLLATALVLIAVAPNELLESAAHRPPIVFDAGVSPSSRSGDVLMAQRGGLAATARRLVELVEESEDVQSAAGVIILKNCFVQVVDEVLDDLHRRL